MNLIRKIKILDNKLLLKFLGKKDMGQRTGYALMITSGMILLTILLFVVLMIGALITVKITPEATITTSSFIFAILSIMFMSYIGIKIIVLDYKAGYPEMYTNKYNENKKVRIEKIQSKIEKLKKEVS